MFEFDGESVALPEAVLISVSSAEQAIRAAALGDSSSPAIAEAVGHLRALDEPLAALSTDADDAIATRAADLRLLGRWLFAIAIAAVTMRLFVMKLPLAARLSREQAALREANEMHASEAARQELSSQLSDGLEAAESEPEAYRVVGRALREVVANQSAELLMADSSKAHLKVAVEHPVDAGPRCAVTSPWSCPAVRRGRAMVYEDSTAVNACPHLVSRSQGACSAVCVPVSFMGNSMGVLHVTGSAGSSPDGDRLEALRLVASQTAVRIGTLRSFAQAELQASTDVLTGLPNRRATEDRLRRLVSESESGAVAVADLDRFKHLNDTFGHEAGDRALRMFAESVRSALRDDDWIGRWGGEEFVLVLPALTAIEAKAALDRVRERLAVACGRAEAPPVTVSIGVVDTTAASTTDELVRFADEALLAAKAQGRDRTIAGPILTRHLASLKLRPTVSQQAEA